MSVKRFSIGISLVTILCLVYIQQQTAIIGLAYEGKKKQDLLNELLDQKDVLAYNIDVLESLPNIQTNLLSKQGDFEIAKEYKIVRLNDLPDKNQKLNIQKVATRLLSFRIPWLERQAEAKTAE